MVRFETVLPELVHLCESWAGEGAIERAGVLRDYRGRVRLILQPDPGTTPDPGPLEQELRRRLSAYFVPPIWLTTESESGRMAQKALALFQPWSPPAHTDPLSGLTTTPKEGRWYKLERRLSKQAWLEDGTPSAPWPLQAGRPAIVTFYSFKGGVGRTTSLLSCAWQLARKGKQVAVIDLDLEAPGLGVLLGTSTERGVLDFIVDHMATDGSVQDLAGMSAPAAVLGAEADRVQVYPAGALGADYLEKLARVDFLADGAVRPQHESGSPVERALRELLHKVAARRPRPDYILLDSRAGLHDLAGLSLHGLAHVDVVVGRASAQSYQGIDLTLQTLGQRKQKHLLCVVVHSLAYANESDPAAQQEERAFLAQSFTAFDRHIYQKYWPDGQPPPTEQDQGAHHIPQVLRHHTELERFHAIDQNVAQALFLKDYQALCARIEMLCTPGEVP